MQLDLWELELAVMPWRGVSPRGLTRARLGVIFKPRGEEHERFFADPDQLDLFPEDKPRPLYKGAPLLIPLLEVT